MPQRGDIRIINETGASNDTRVEVNLADGHDDWLELRGIIRVELAPIDAGANEMRAHILIIPRAINLRVPAAFAVLAEDEREREFARAQGRV